MHTVAVHASAPKSGRSREQAFVTYVADLVRRDGIARNALLRGLYTLPELEPGMWPYLGRWVAGCGPWATTAHYLVASLLTLHPRQTDAGNFGAHLAVLRRALQPSLGAMNNLQAQVQVLWQLQPAMLPSRLHSLVLQCKQRDVPIHWSQLLHDLIRWDYMRKTIIQTWIYSFLTPDRTPESEPAASERLGNR